MKPVRLLTTFLLAFLCIGLFALPRGEAQTGPLLPSLPFVEEGEGMGPTPQPTDVTPPLDFNLDQIVPDWDARYFEDYEDHSRDCDYYLDSSHGKIPEVVRFDNAIDFDWGDGRPTEDVDSDKFLVCWDVMQSLAPGIYRFHMYSDDGMRVFINNQKIAPLDQWRDQLPTWYWADVSVPGNSLEYLFRVDYYDHWTRAIARFWWESLADYSDWKGEYFRNEKLSGGPVITRNDREINFNWDRGSPSLGLSYDHFSARWSRKMEFAGGFYRFWVQSDDGVRLYIDPEREFVCQPPDIRCAQRVEAGRYLNPILDRWYIRSLATDHVDIYLTPGPHTIILEYFEYVGPASVKMWWERW